MVAVLYALGIVIGVVGLMAIGFAVPIRDFSLGNTLILSGTFAVIGGILSIALAAILRELAKVRGVFEKAAQSIRQAEGGPPRLRAPQPPRPAPQPQPAPALEPARVETPELRPPAREESRPPPPPPPHPGLFVSIRGARAGRTPEAAESADAQAQPPAAAVARAGGGEVAFEPKFGAPSAPAHPSPALLATRTAARFEGPRGDVETAIASERAAERAARNLFDTVWPSEQKPAAAQGPEPTPPPAEAAMPPREEPKPAPQPALSPKTEEPPAILKSGVIDGMAYTLYTDGSIEAQLPQGLIRFASIDELRAHLENQG
jgi:hypothetical protein